jgi:hypothetical protein
VFIGAAPASGAHDYDFDFDDDSPPAIPVQPPIVRPDVPARPAVVVGLAQAQAARASQKRASEKISAPPRATAAQAAAPPPQLPPPPPPPPGARSRQMPAVVPSAAPSMTGTAPVPTGAVPTQLRRPPPAPFADEPTRQVDDELLNALRNAPTAKPAPRPALPRPSPSTIQAAAGRPSAIQAAAGRPSAIQAAAGRPSGKAPLPRPSVIKAAPDEPTRLAHVGSLGPGHPPDDDLGIDREIDHALAHGIDHGIDELTRPADDFPPRFLASAPTTEPGMEASFDDHRDPEEATRTSHIEGIAAKERPRHHGPSHDERTRAVNIRNDPSISDIDWDLD